VPKAAMFSDSLALPTTRQAVVQPATQLDFAPFDATHLLTLLSTIVCIWLCLVVFCVVLCCVVL
jgi:uncharacterized membrane protein